MTKIGPNRYSVLGYVVWQGARWYLRRRLPSRRRVVLTGAGAFGAFAGAVVLAKRLSS